MIGQGCDLTQTGTVALLTRCRLLHQPIRYIFCNDECPERWLALDEFWQPSKESRRLGGVAQRRSYANQRNECGIRSSHCYRRGGSRGSIRSRGRSPESSVAHPASTV